MKLQPVTVKHLQEHLDYPASGEKIIDSCTGRTEVSEEDLMKIDTVIDPEGSYESADEVIEEVESRPEDTEELEG